MPSDPATSSVKGEGSKKDRKQLVSSIVDASAEGDLELLKQLFDQWRQDTSHPSPAAEDLQCALSWAAENNHVNTVSYLLDQGTEITPHVAWGANRGSSIAVWQAFLDYGWDMNSDGGSDAPVIKHMVRDGALLKWFLEHGANPNLHGAKGEHPLDGASHLLKFEAVELLLQYGAKIELSNALHRAAGARRDDPRYVTMMAYLLDHGADINALEHQGNPEYFNKMKTHPRVRLGTALHCAANSGHKERVQFLLERGADPNVPNTHGYKAAASTRDTTGIQELIDSYRNSEQAST